MDNKCKTDKKSNSLKNRPASSSVNKLNASWSRRWLKISEANKSDPGFDWALTAYISYQVWY